MATIKSLRPRFFCNVLDVRRWNEELTSTVKTDAFIESKILDAKDVILMYLSKVYGDESNLRTTPYAGVILPDTDNTGTASLLAVQVATTAYTETWTIEFTSATAYTITGSCSGSQGTGDTTVDSSSTNSDITFLTTAFTGTPAIGDIFYIPVYDVYSVIASLASMLAAAFSLGVVYNENVPNENDFATTLYDRAIDILDRLSRPFDDDGLVIDDTALTAMDSLDIEPIAVSYVIDENGDDKTTYRPDYPDEDGDETI